MQMDGFILSTGPNGFPQHALPVYIRLKDE